MQNIDLISKYYYNNEKRIFVYKHLLISEISYDNACLASDHIPIYSVDRKSRLCSSGTYNTMSLLGHNNIILNKRDTNNYICGVHEGYPEQSEHSERYNILANNIEKVLNICPGGLALQEFMPFILTRLIDNINIDHLFESKSYISNNLKVTIISNENGTSFNNGVFAYATKNKNVKKLSSTKIIDKWLHNGVSCSKTIGQIITITLNDDNQYKVVNVHLDKKDGIHSIPLIAEIVENDNLIEEIVGDFNLNINKFLLEWGNFFKKKYKKVIQLKYNYDIPYDFQFVDHSFAIER
jgi:hypothetical protein